MARKCCPREPATEASLMLRRYHTPRCSAQTISQACAWVQVARTLAGAYVLNRLSGDGARQKCRTQDILLPSLTTTVEGMPS